MKKYSVTLREHEEYGEIGLVVDTQRDYFEPAISGLQCAHDIIEHTVKPHYDGYIDELMALGGVIAGRITYGWSFKYGTINLDDIKSDISSLATSAYHGQCDFVNDECNNTLKDKDFVQSIRNMVCDGLIEAMGEYNDDYLNPVMNESDFQRLVEEKYNVNRIVAWICKGYQAYKKRFANIQEYTIQHIFSEIQRVCDNFIKNGIEYQRATLCVDFTSGKVYLQEEYEDDY
jgi:hypothetical protein